MPDKTSQDANKLTQPMPSGDAIKKRRSELEGMGKEDLVKLVLELQASQPRITAPLDPSAVDLNLTFETGAKASDFVNLPAKRLLKPPAKRPPVWTVKLVCSDKNLKPMAIRIHDDVYVGRTTRASTADLDLTTYGIGAVSVSRRHALLRPTPDGLQVIDLSSSNGTMVNGVKLHPGTPFTLSDGDVLSFGQVHFKLNLAKVPEAAAAAG